LKKPVAPWWKPDTNIGHHFLQLAYSHYKPVKAVMYFIVDLSLAPLSVTFCINIYMCGKRELQNFVLIQLQSLDLPFYVPVE
jgi:hypothetical protein